MHRQLLASSIATYIIGSAAQIAPADWPTGSAAPITGNPVWTRDLLQGSTIPNIPLNANISLTWDTTGMVISCQGNPNHWALTYDDGPVSFDRLVT